MRAANWDSLQQGRAVELIAPCTAYLYRQHPLITTAGPFALPAVGRWHQQAPSALATSLQSACDRSRGRGPAASACAATRLSAAARGLPPPPAMVHPQRTQLLGDLHAKYIVDFSQVRLGARHGWRGCC